MGEDSHTIAAAETATGPRKRNHGSMDGGEDEREREREEDRDRDKETETER